MNQKMLESIELSEEMNSMIIEALMSKDDSTSMYATKLIIALTAELKRYESTIAVSGKS